MGTLAHFMLRWIRERHGLRSFVETGTGDGAGVAQAVAAGFERVVSIELVPELAAAVQMRFKRHPEVEILVGDSAILLPRAISSLPPGPALFWLDAHFPGADYGLGRYEDEENPAIRLPLEREVAMVARMRAGQADVVLIDDARIYQLGPYGDGNLPEDWPALKGVARSLDFVREAFGATHGMVIDHADQGYVMVVPRAR